MQFEFCLNLKVFQYCACTYNSSVVSGGGGGALFVTFLYQAGTGENGRRVRRGKKLQKVKEIFLKKMFWRVCRRCQNVTISRIFYFRDPLLDRLLPSYRCNAVFLNRSKLVLIFIKLLQCNIPINIVIIKVKLG